MINFEDKVIEIMSDLTTYPAMAEEIEFHLVELMATKRNLQKTAEDSEMEIIQSAGGISALGKNDAERKLGVNQLLRSSEHHSSLVASLVTVESAIAEAQAELRNTERFYSAATYKARLLAGYMSTIGAIPSPAPEATAEDLGI